MNELHSFLAAREEIAEEWLLYYQHRRQEIGDRRDEIIDAGTKPTNGGKTTVVSDVCANKTIRLSRTWDDKDWLDAVDYCYQHYSDKQKRLLRIRWRQVTGKIICGRQPWIEDAILHFADQTGEWPEPNTISRWWREMVIELSRWAEARGCYK